MLAATYVLPLRRNSFEDDDLCQYVSELAAQLEVIVVDGSPAPVFQSHAARLPASVLHLPPDQVTLMGKVGGVLTGLARASHERVIIGDDDVRYTPDQLRRLYDLLATAEVVRPQNYFDPLPWHARLDTARTLLNRTSGGDWPGTLGVRRSWLMATGGYDGSVMFENLELVRTIKAVGGREIVPLDLLVKRAPPSAKHFWSQRVRQAYDELARPWRLIIWLTLLPLTLVLLFQCRWRVLAGLVLGSLGLTEVGRQRKGGRQTFPLTSSLLAPVWLAERAICSWLAMWVRLRHGGIPYRGSVLRVAANSARVLETRHLAARARLAMLPDKHLARKFSYVESRS